MFFQHNKFGIVRNFFILSNIMIASGHQHEMLGDTGWAVADINKKSRAFLHGTFPLFPHWFGYSPFRILVIFRVGE